MDQLQQLEAELEHLANQVNFQQQEIYRLREQLRRFKPVDGLPPATKFAPQSTTSQYSDLSLENLIGLRFIHIIGIIVLVIGLSLGVKYAIDKNLISAGMRIMLAYMAGAILFFLSVRVKKNYAAFSAILFSGAMASIYFTTYAAFSYYNLIPFGVAFGLMIALTVLTTQQAMAYNRQEIALLGLVGAYAIPFLISKNTDNPQLLFLYITIINIGVVFLCIKKPWLLVGRVAQAISWLLFIGWATVHQTGGIKTWAIVYMVLFFSLFLLNALAPRMLHKQSLNYFTAFQVLLNNFLFFVASLSVVEYGYTSISTAFVTLAFSFLAGVQAILFSGWRESFAQKIMSFYALLLFISFIGLQWDGITVTLLWLLTAVIIFTIGASIKSTVLRMSAIILIGITLVKLIILDSMKFSTLEKVFAYLVLGTLLLLVSFFYQKFKKRLFGEEERQS